MKIAILAVPFSDNLGDYLIYHCLKAEILRLAPGTSVVPVDLSGRVSFDEDNYSTRKRNSSLLAKMPTWMRPLFPFIKFGLVDRSRLRQAYASQLDTATHCIIGGGNIFADLNLNFPVKLAIAFRLLRSKKIPIHVHAVGVSENWSFLGRAMIKSSLRRARIRSLSVRDQESYENVRLNGLYPINKVSVVRDPGLLASKNFPNERNPKKGRVGLNVISMEAIRLDSNRKIKISTMEIFVELTINLIRSGFKPILFTNGSVDDEELKGQVVRHLNNAGFSGYEVAARPKIVGDLIDVICSCESVISFRLHANIICYSYGIPSVGVSWDKKVESFFKSVGRDRFCLDANEVTANDLLAKLSQSISSEITDLERFSVIEQAQTQIEAMITDMRGNT